MLMELQVLPHARICNSCVGLSVTGFCLRALTQPDVATLVTETEDGMFEQEIDSKLLQV